MDDPKQDSFYSILGLQKSCSKSDVRCAYRKLAMKWHPDKCATGGTPAVDSAKASECAKARFQAIQEAYSVLSDNNKRLMYDAGVYDDDDDELEMSAFMGEMAAMMAASTKEFYHGEYTLLDRRRPKHISENYCSDGLYTGFPGDYIWLQEQKIVDATESFDDLKAMFSNIADTDRHKPASSNKRVSDCLSQKADEKHWRGMPTSDHGSEQGDIFNLGLCSDAAALDSGFDSLYTEGDAVDSLQELRQMFMNIVDPEFYASACSGKASSASLSQKDSENHWMNGSSAFEELVAETLFPEGRISGGGLERSSVLESKNSTTFCSDVRGTSSSSARGEKKNGKKQKLCQEQKAVSNPSLRCDFSSAVGVDFNFYEGSSENEDWGSTYFL